MKGLQLKKSAKQSGSRRAVEEKNPPTKLSSDEIGELIFSHAQAGAQKEIELKRREAYIERSTQKLVRNLLQGGKKAEIFPTYDPCSGFRYETVESVFDGSIPLEKAEAFLERLCHLEILEKTFFDTVSACPVCGSTFVTLHYSCPKCTSHCIFKTGLTEHIPCGNIDERDKYNQGYWTPKCPKCGARLVEGQYRDMGLWYVCRECGERFEHPHLDLTCRSCGNQFTIETATVREISKYFLNPDKEQEIRQNVASLESIYRLLTELDFSVETSASVIGEKSGIQHNFSLLAKKKFGDRENIVAVDHAVGDVEVSAASLILFIYKISEVKVDLPIFVAIPKLSETAGRIAQGYNIMVIEGIPQEREHLDMLNDEIQRRLGEGTIAEHGMDQGSQSKADIVHQWIFRRGERVDVWRNIKGMFVGEKEAQAYGNRGDWSRESSSQSLEESKPKRQSLIERMKRAIKGEISGSR